MKEYLKMADVFEGMVAEGLTVNGPSIHGENHAFYANTKDSRIAVYAAHAINSHDELVQTNQELLEVLGRVVGDVKALANQSYGVYGLHQNGDIAPWHSLFAGGFFESWLLSIDDAEAAIEKAKGGKK